MNDIFTDRKISMIALDLDGTTLRTDKTLSDRNRRGLEAAMKRGIHVVVATGRSFTSLPDAILHQPGIEYAITSNGASIVYMSSGQRIKNFFLTEKSVEDILHAFPNHQIWETFIHGKPYASASYYHDPRMFGNSEIGAAYVRSTRTPVEDMRTFLWNHRGELDAIDILVGSQSQQLEYREILARQVKNIYVTSSVPQLIEISHADAGKAASVAWLAGHLGIPMSEVMAFGDAENDLEMLIKAGIGVAMGNASDALKRQADFVAPDNNHDGVGITIEALLSKLFKTP